MNLVNLGEFVSGESSKNIVNSSVETNSTNNAGIRKIKNSEIKRVIPEGRLSYADAVRTQEHTEVERRGVNKVLSSSEDHALSKSSELSFSNVKLTKI